MFFNCELPTAAACREQVWCVRSDSRTSWCVIAGTMSGGGGRVMKGRMSSTIVAEIDESTMQNLEKQLEQVT